MSVLVWHYHDDDLPGPDAAVELSLRGIPDRAGSVLVQHYRIDRDHSNAYEAWKHMGSPPRPTVDQTRRAEALGTARGKRVSRTGSDRKLVRSHSGSRCRDRPSRWSCCGGESSGEGL